jgi:hypothetical protein
LKKDLITRKHPTLLFQMVLQGVFVVFFALSRT